VTARVWIADWGYQPLRKDFRGLKLTGLFRLLLSGEPGPVEDLTGGLPQLFGRAGLVPPEQTRNVTLPGVWIAGSNALDMASQSNRAWTSNIRLSVASDQSG
jgi:hypothetical protein